MTSRRYRAWLAAALGLVLAACSGVRFAYNQLDWLVPRYVEHYVALDAGQGRMLRTHMVQLRAWHCGTQLAAYAGDLRAINDDFQNGAVTRERLAAHHGRILEHWQALKEQAAPRLAELLAMMSQTQVEELFSNLERDNRKFQAEHVDRPETARRKTAAKIMRQRLESWIGDLNPAQRRAVARWSETLVLNGEERLRLRRRWQAGLRRALAYRDRPERFAAAIRELVVHPGRYWSDEYREQYARVREQTLALLAEIAATLDAAQREHLARRVERWAGDFEQLACARPPVQVTAADPVRR